MDAELQYKLDVCRYARNLIDSRGAEGSSPLPPLGQKLLVNLAVGASPNNDGVVGRRGAQVILGGQMRFLRQAAGATLAEVADYLGTSRGHLSNVERGRDRPSWDIVAYYEERFHAD